MLSISYRSNKLEYVLEKHTTALDVKKAIIAHSAAIVKSAWKSDEELTTTNTSNNDLDQIQPSEIKLLFKGKVINDDYENLWNLLQQTKGSTNAKSSKPMVYKIVAMGISSTKAEQFDHELVLGMERTKRIVRDDLTQQGHEEIERRVRLGKMLQNKASKRSSGLHTTKYGFHNIVTIPNLPNEDQARKILESLATDPGILACMDKRKWNVGTLGELYPEGKVGQSPVCVMGLNTNFGQMIQLRLRTDDLKGFRKILDIRKVLYHELAHNVHSEHDSQFFQLMRQVEKECVELDWTMGAGLSSDSGRSTQLYTGGSYKLGGDDSHTLMLTRRELAARAAEMRMTDEESMEIEYNCGCNNNRNLFLPPATTAIDEDMNIVSTHHHSNSSGDNCKQDMNDDDQTRNVKDNINK